MERRTSDEESEEMIACGRFLHPRGRMRLLSSHPIRCGRTFAHFKRLINMYQTLCHNYEDLPKPLNAVILKNQCKNPRWLITLVINVYVLPLNGLCVKFLINHGLNLGTCHANQIPKLAAPTPHANLRPSEELM